MDFKIPSDLEKIVKEIEKQGGKSYLVGGAVIDILQDREMKDWDIEVYKLSYDGLRDLLSSFGSAKLVGQAFGVINLRIDDVVYDFSIPRTESAVGIGHKDFNIELAPDISPKEAAYRRDLTINSMYIDLKDGSLVDPYDGYADLEKGIIRHTSDKFIEDPLRVLRIMQLLPRKGKIVDPKTIELCRSLVDNYPTLSKERVFEEWGKLLMKAEKPSIGLDFLDDCGWIKWFPELEILKEIEQNPDWHPEGNVWIHTKKVLDNAAYVREKIDPEWKLAFMYGALLHDVGKAVTTDEDLTAYGHDKKGVEIAERFMKRITEEKELIGMVLKIVECHMRPGQLYRSKAGNNAWKRLHNKIRLDIIGYISLCDAAGRCKVDIDEKHEPSEAAFKYFSEYGKEEIPAVLMGRDLIALGYEPGPMFGKFLKKAYDIQIDENVDDKQVLIDRLGLNEIPR